MENLDDIIPYLKLREGEEILFVKRFKGDLPIKWLTKYHEPEKFPEHLITIKKDYYFFDQIDIITNFRLIKFGINYNYMEEDRVTPISEIFHHENLFLWVNLEDIIDFKVDFGINGVGTMGFKFFGKGRLKVKERPLHFIGYNYEEYCKIKDIAVKIFKFELQEIDQEEDKEIQKIIEKNDNINIWMFIGVIIIGFLIVPPIFPSESQDYQSKFIDYTIAGLFVFYILFFLLFNIIIHYILLKKHVEKTFFTLMKIDFAWHIGPTISVILFVIEFMILAGDLLLLNFIDKEWIALLISIGFWIFVIIFAVAIDLLTRKKKKRKRNAFNKEV